MQSADAAPTPDTRSPAPVWCFEGAPSGITEATYSKMCTTGTNHPIPSRSPAHTGPCAHPRPGNSGVLGRGKRVWGSATKWSAYAGRREALTAQIQAPGSLFCAAQSRPRPDLRLWSTSPVYGEVLQSLRLGLSQRHTPASMHGRRPRGRTHQKHNKVARARKLHMPREAHPTTTPRIARWVSRAHHIMGMLTRARRPENFWCLASMDAVNDRGIPTASGVQQVASSSRLQSFGASTVKNLEVQPPSPSSQQPRERDVLRCQRFF